MTDQYPYSNSTGTLTKFLGNTTTTTAAAAAALDARLIIHNVSVNAPSKRTLSFTIKAWATIKDVKDQIFARLAIPTSAQRLYLAGPLQNYSHELPNHWTLHDASITQTHASQQDLFLIDSRSLSSSSTTYPYNNTSSLNSISIAISMKKYTPKPLFEVLQRTRAGFAAGFKPVLVLDGSGGTYFLHDAYKAKIAVFKPADEEPYAPNNPRGYVNTNQPTQRANPFFNHPTNPYSPFGQDDDDDEDFLQQQTEGPIISLRAGIHPGESCLREVAAYLLDHDRFSGVPMTTLVQAKHEGFHISGSRLKVYEGGASIGPHSTTPTSSDDPRPTKIGSFQQFVLAECSMDDLSPSMISVEEVQKIAILDIRLMNADRNSANLLCRRKHNTNQLELVPIDHGYCLRSVCDVSWFDWCWLDWPQVKEPLSTRMKEYVNNLNIEQDVQILKDVLKIRPKALDFFRASSMLLQAGVRAGLCLYDIAHLCCRNDNNGEVPSKLEMLIEKSFELAISAVENGKWHHSAALRALEHQLATCKSPEEEPAYKNRLSSSPFRSNKRVLLKSVSSVDLSEEKRKADVGGTTLFAACQRQHDSIHSLPDSENTSGSDSDSCGCDVIDDTIAESDHVVSSEDLEQDDHEDCEQWAASVIADVSLDPPARNRSFSDSSSSNGGESNLSQSPAGFWQVRPGSIRTSTTSGHLKSVSWSALDSKSENCSSMVTNMDGAPNNDEDDDEDLVSNSESPTSVTNAAVGLLTSAGNGVISPISSSSPKMILSPPTSLQERQKTSDVMKRSQSYCALSVAPAFGSRGKNINITKSAIRGGNKCSSSLLRSTADHDQLHEYYLKFIDLLITREIIGIANTKISK